MKNNLIFSIIAILSNISHASPPENYIFARETENSTIYFNKQNDPNYHNPKVDIYVDHKDGSKSFFNANFNCDEAELKNTNTGYFYREEFKNKKEIKYKSSDEIAKTIRAICEKLSQKNDTGFENSNFKVKISSTTKLKNGLTLSPSTNGIYSIISSNAYRSVGPALAEVSIEAQNQCSSQTSKTWIFNSETNITSGLFGTSYTGKVDFFCIGKSNKDYSIQEFTEPTDSSDYIYFPGRYGMLALTKKSDSWIIENKELAIGAAEKYCSAQKKSALISHHNNDGNNGWYAQFHFICN